MNEVTLKRKAQMPYTEELILRFSTKLSEGDDGETLATKLGFEYAYGQIKLDEKTRNLCIFTVKGREFTDYYRFLKRFYGLAGNPTIFQERINRTLEYKHPEGLHYIKLVTKGDVKKHEAEVRETMKQLENAGFRLNPKQCEFFDREIEWVGQKFDQIKKDRTIGKRRTNSRNTCLNK